ncbi:MAG TPA: tetratricopeptide repeat protein [Bryobacteraceae bacterium]|nr:tetratricopeptide repeat protein [Bryobacteraceae bacterium]
MVDYGYNRSITPIEKAPRDHLLFLSIGLILVVIGWLFAWSNHFANSFHFDDVPVIVANDSVHHLSNIPRFFTIPRISSLEKDSAVYRPLLSTWFALDYRFWGANAFAFESENFIWFTAQLLVMFALLRRIPGINNPGAGFGTLLFGLHPVIADTVNYPLQRGTMMGAFGVTAGLLIWSIWPWGLPQTLPLKLKRVPEHGWDEYLRKNFKRLDSRYLGIIHAPVELHLWPVALALLCDPATAVFAPILVVYILLFEKKRKLRHAIPAGVLCIGYWIFQRVFTWNLGEFSRTPATNYVFSQPWVALRYLFHFFVPAHLTVDTGFTAFDHIWNPLAIAGFFGIAGLMGLAVFIRRKAEWKATSFGIWWFLIALVPDAITPHHAVEADWRMFLPFAGLTVAVANAASQAVVALTRRAEESPQTPYPRVYISITAGAVALALLALLGWGTFERNTVWASESTLWRDASEANPSNGRALMRYGVIGLSDRDPRPAFERIRAAALVSPGDPIIEMNLGRAYERLSQLKEAEVQFRQATADGPAWSPAYSSYGEWLQTQSRSHEASQMAEKAVALDPYDLTARRVLMDVAADAHLWTKLNELAIETLRLFPDNPDGQRSQLVAQTGLEQIGRAETQAKTKPSVDNYLNLSVLYFQTQRYSECIKAAREALKVNPNQAEAYANIAAAYHTLGNLDETIAALREEVRLNPDLPSAKSNLAIELAVKEKESPH